MVWNILDQQTAVTNKQRAPGYIMKKTKTILFACFIFLSLDVFAAQKIYQTIDPEVGVVGNKLEVDATVKFSFLKKVKLKELVERIEFVSPAIGCVDTYYCSAKNFRVEDNKLLADVFIDLDMDGNIDSIKKGTFLAYTNDSRVDISKMTIIYVDTNKGRLEDGANQTFYSIILKL